MPSCLQVQLMVDRNISNCKDISKIKETGTYMGKKGKREKGRSEAMYNGDSRQLRVCSLKEDGD